MTSKTLVLNGKVAAVWQLHRDGSIEHFHFNAPKNGDDNKVLHRVVTRPGDKDYEATLRLFDEAPVAA